MTQETSRSLGRKRHIFEQLISGKVDANEIVADYLSTTSSFNMLEMKVEDLAHLQKFVKCVLEDAASTAKEEWDSDGPGYLNNSDSFNGLSFWEIQLPWEENTRHEWEGPPTTFTLMYEQHRERYLRAKEGERTESGNT